MVEISSMKQASENLSTFSIEAEQQVLGALLANNDDITVIGGLLEKDHFYDPVHARIFEAIKTRSDSGQLASPITLKPMFVKDEGLGELGGPAYLLRLVGFAVARFALLDYATMVVDFHAKRKLLDVFSDARDRINAAEEGAASIATDVETASGALLTTTSNKPLIQSHLSNIMKAVQSAADAFQGVSIPGISTGLKPMDDALGGLYDSDFIIIGGRPSMGKTTLAQNLIFNAAKNNVGVFFPTLEMSGAQTGYRFMSMGMARRGINVSYRDIRSGNMSEAQFRDLVDEGREQESLPIWTGERDVRDVSRLRSAAKRAHQKMADTDAPLGLIVIDYLQLIQNSKSKSAYDRVSAASDLCKSLAIELDVPVVALAQLHRGIEDRENKVPQLSDLRESGKIEEDADTVLFTYRESYYLERAMKGEQDLQKKADMMNRHSQCHTHMDVVIAKQRSGPLSTINLFADMATSHIYEDKSSEADQLI